MASLVPDRLIDYLILVGPSNKPSDFSLCTEGSPSSPATGRGRSIPSILWRYPLQDVPSQPLSGNVVCFCQPDGYHCSSDFDTSKIHYFMLTSTETNVRTYGTCISFPYLMDPSIWCPFPKLDDSIQEWSLLTVCILSRCDNFSFFVQALTSFVHFFDHFCGSNLTWDLLIRSQDVPLEGPSFRAIQEVSKWVESLLSLPIPKYGEEIMEVELEVDPAVTIGYPPSSRLPFVDLPVHHVLQKLDIHLVIEIFKLLLLEHKVIVYSQDFGFASMCVLTIIRLFYPLQYLFPVIPLLPASLLNAENLLLVPTPYFIGVSSSFLQKITYTHKMETWLIDLDNKKMESPIQQDLDLIDSFPYSLHQLQADLKLAIDSLNEKSKAGSISSSELAKLQDETDILIRIAFVEFLTSSDMLGLLDSHLTIFRLFPRPVVSLRKASFLAAYSKQKLKVDMKFISYFIQTQSVEYYMEWVLNPPNRAFEEIRKGICEMEHVGDKLQWWRFRLSLNFLQFTLYSTDLDSILYQEMLNYKANQIPDSTSVKTSISSTSSLSDFEILEKDQESLSSSSYASDESSLLPKTYITIDVHPSITITESTPINVESPNEVFLSFHDSNESSINDHMPLPPHTSESDHQVELTAFNEGSSSYTESCSKSVSISPTPDVANSNHHISDNESKMKSLSKPGTPEVDIPRVGSWLNLRGSLGDILEFSSSADQKTHKEEDKSFNVVRSVTWSSAPSLHELETQIKELVARIGAGHGLPWPKPLFLKAIATEERSRVALLRLLELRLGIRKQTNLLLSADREVVPVMVSRSVYKGILDLLKYLVSHIETTLQADIDTPLFSVFLIFRIALCICAGGTKKITKTSDTLGPLERPLRRASSPAAINETTDKHAATSSPVPPLKMPKGQMFQPTIDIPVETELKQITVKANGYSIGTDIRRVRFCQPKLLEGVTENIINPETYLYVDMLKGFGPIMKGIVVRRQFWLSLFASVVQADRKYLGWNEKTVELYQRYDSLPDTKRHKFGYEEDNLLSIILHNLLIFLLMIGISPNETMDISQRISARTRLATVEEKLLQSTMSELFKDGGVSVKNLAILSLYSELHPIVTYVIHHGISITAPIFKLQITDDVCILRRFPDERITCRFWNDRISKISTNHTHNTVSFLYQEETGDYYHHFHSKQYNEVYQCLQVLVKNMVL